MSRRKKQGTSKQAVILMNGVEMGGGGGGGGGGIGMGNGMGMGGGGGGGVSGQSRGGESNFSKLTGNATSSSAMGHNQGMESGNSKQSQGTFGAAKKLSTVGGSKGGGGGGGKAKNGNKKVKESHSKVNGNSIRTRYNSVSQNKIQKVVSRAQFAAGISSSAVRYQESQGFSPTVSKSVDISAANSNSNSNSVPVNLSTTSVTGPTESVVKHPMPPSQSYHTDFHHPYHQTHTKSGKSSKPGQGQGQNQNQNQNQSQGHGQGPGQTQSQGQGQGQGQSQKMARKLNEPGSNFSMHNMGGSNANGPPVTKKIRSKIQEGSIISAAASNLAAAAITGVSGSGPTASNSHV